MTLQASAAAQSTYPEIFCRDGWDNDGDGWIDYPDDPGCRSTSDDSEFDDNDHDARYDDRYRSRFGRFACDDGRDNDHDGFIDYPDDAGCSSRRDDSEGGNRSSERAACDDGRDNDDDGDVDYPDDPGCSSYGDTSEGTRSSRRSDRYACNDGRDNDNDGDYDYPDDDGCRSLSDDTEDEVEPRTRRGRNECNDNRDNDGDGYFDYPADRDCDSRNDDDEADGGRFGSSDVTIDLSADRFEALPGDVVTYTILVRNDSSRSIDDVRLDVTYDRSIVTILDADQAELDGGRVRWSIGRMARGTTRTVRMRARLDDAVPTGRTVTTTATAYGSFGTMADTTNVRTLRSLPQTGVMDSILHHPTDHLARVAPSVRHAAAPVKRHASILWTAGTGLALCGLSVARYRKRT